MADESKFQAAHESYADFASLCSKGLYIGGQWVQPRLRGMLDVINPATEAVMCRCPAASAEDADAAVTAATTALATWKRTSGAQRAAYLEAIAARVRELKPSLSRMECIDSGKPFGEAEWDIDDVASCFDYYAQLARELDAKATKSVDVGDSDYKTVIKYEPVGVVAAVTPWNYPLLMVAWKVAAALAAGCTMVVKPSEVTPLTSLRLGLICDDVGLPDGVLNIIPGTGAGVGAPLVSHKGVAKVAFTGSVATGARIMGMCAPDVRAVSLELGGKSPVLVFPDADIDKAVEWVAFGCFWTNGQICSATSRLLVHEDIADEFVSKLVQLASSLKCADPLDASSQVGPLSSAVQHAKVLAHIKTAQQQGAQLLTGGGRPKELPKGYYVRPTIFDKVTRDMTLWQEEVFGPVLAITRFGSEEDAITMANDCKYGLAAAVFSKCEARLARITEALETGIVWNNCSQPCFCQLPWGGRKLTGFGRDLGEEGLWKYLEAKSVVSYVADAPLGWYVPSKL